LLGDGLEGIVNQEHVVALLDPIRHEVVGFGGLGELDNSFF
jgi:hypothetical protein